MSSTYTGNPTGIEAPSSAPSLNVVPLGTMPSDGNGLNVASVAQRIKVALDGLAWTWDTTIGMLPTILSRANVWMGQQIFQAVTTVGDEIDSFNSAATTADWSLFLNGNFGSSGHFRLYYSQGKVCLTRNAFYTAATQLWAQDNTALNATRLLLTNDALDFQYHVALAGTWNDAAWGNIGVFTGSTSELAVTKVTAAGRALLTTDFSAGGGYGATGLIAAVTGTQMCGSVDVTAQGGAYSTNATIVLHFPIAYSGVPHFVASYINLDDVTDTGGIGAGAVTTDLTLTLREMPTDGQTYRISFIGIGG